VTSWSDATKVDEYLARIDRVPRQAGEELLVEVLPAAPRRVLDLGCGDGRLTALALSARPGIEHAVAVDISPPMLTEARERFADEPRVDVRVWDLEEPLSPEFDDFDVVLSGLAIHHLPDARKQALFGEVFRVLRPGGLFANLEVVASPTPELHIAFRTAIGRVADDPEDQLVDVETQLRWMREAGFVQVDCLWKWRGFALLVGASPARA
jgi:SAM-dependent methyltransferase